MGFGGSNHRLINSRKLSAAQLSVICYSRKLYDEETAIMVEGPEDVQYINKQIEVTDIAINKIDTYRIKDEMVLPSNKGNISSLLFQDIGLSNVEIRLLEDKFTIKGELPVFLLYTSANEENPIEYYESDIPFTQQLIVIVAQRI